MCECDLCKLSRRITAEKSKMTPETLEIINVIWGRMEAAETEVCMRKLKDSEQCIRV